ncbi:MAG: recombinase family protein [Oscillospiraceae bacterium]|nr:recombinase family protein [Oscillospiraceae bacterium]
METIIIEPKADALERWFAYVRVSSRDQHIDRQLLALKPYGVPQNNIYVEKQSGKDFDRKQYRKMVRKLKSGDVLLVKSIDRLGRNYAEIIEQWRLLTKKKKVDIVVLDMPVLDTRQFKDTLGTFIADMVLAILSYASHIERENMLTRQAEGIAVAQAKGVRFGKQPADLPKDFEEIFALWQSGGITGVEAAFRCGVSRSTLYTRTKERRDELALT